MKFSGKRLNKETLIIDFKIVSYIKDEGGRGFRQSLSRGFQEKGGDEGK